MTKRERILLISAGCLLVLAALCLTVLPGVRFSGYLSLALAGVCSLWVVLGRWAEKSRLGKACKRLFLVGLAAVVFLLSALEGEILLQRKGMPAIRADAVIVLGAGVNGEAPSMVLQSRIDAAAAYLQANPDIPVVLSGGQGEGERISEAECMRRALWTNSEEENRRYLLEERSTNTAENFAYSREVLEAQGIDPDTALIAVVTSDFHICRANRIAVRQGYGYVFGVPAELPWPWLEANYYVREAFAMVKTLMFD